MVKKAVLCLLVGIIAVAYGTVVTRQELIGSYKISGTNPDATTYSGIMTLTLEKGTLRVAGQIGAGQEFYGIAMLVGDKLALSYGINQKTTGEMSYINLILYRVKKTGNEIVLDGIWSYGEGIGHERAEKE
jgi:hypothetical protein